MQGTSSVRAQHRRRLAATVAAVLVMALLDAGPTAAQRSERSFSAPLEVVLVNLDVVALDKDGSPVTDLSRDEFRVWEDGAPVEVSHFAAPAAAADGTAATLNLILLLDETRLAPSGRRAGLDQLRRALEAGPVAGLRVMVLAMSPGLEIVSPLTQDLGTAGRALRELEARRRISPQAQERSRLLREMEVAASEVASQGQASEYGRPAPRSARPLEANDYASSVAQSFLHQIQDYARGAGEAQRITSEVLGRLLRSLSGLEGRTALLVVSDGLATNPGEPLIRAWEQLFNNVIQSIALQPRATLLEVDAGGAVRDLLRLASAHRVTVYELRAGSGRDLDAVQAESKGLAFGSGFGSGGSFADAPALALLASATGGRSLAAESRTLSLELGAVVREMASSYSLGYLPPSPGDDVFHTLRVEVTRPGVTLRHREGYVAAAEADSLIDRTLAAAVLGVSDDALGLELAAGTPSRHDDRRVLLPLTVRVPLRRLGLASHGAAHEGRVAVALAVRGADGRVQGLERREFPVAVANSEFPSALGRSVEVLFNLIVEPGALSVGVGVHDLYGDASATSRLEIELGAAPG